ncbi:hypothetical protein FPQ18DRAFT_291902 [Pyronema domesticum]|uniref:TBP-associated factor 6 n=1 Tax=Pyronema omphalodes (strain CBS 100304) TaxID=1076935 RepID=U4LGM7_PYROM|nr:hypothetical protein FPQ18DRAFT_291902 [Pyronema domesticum]CCX31063.1 Similar to Transcription initiation factor TFIID subunit 6; acc. no. O74462 [Pyronema omphalodes CBS 100304]
MSLWNSDTIKDVAESVGISNLHDDVAKNLAMDVEYRIHQVLQEALKFMRHGKRTVLATTDISHALRVLNVEPLYGYDSLRPLRFGEASVGPAQPIYYVEDEEVDFEKLINAPLPKVPREVTFTAHWLAIEGVQPAIPQNPTPSEAHRLSEGVPKGSNTTTSLAATTGNSENVAVKPLVKHILSKELQLYYDRVCSAILDEAPSSSLRSAALSSLRHDPGLHQLLPYFLQFVSEKVTQKLRDLFVLNTMLELLHALLENENLFVEPYVAAIVPPILTCLVGKRLGTEGGNHWDLRDFAASLIALVCKRFGGASHTLLSRLTRACLKHFLDPAKPLGTHYGAITGLAAIGGRESVRVLVVPNLKLYEKVLKKDDQDPEEVRRVVEAIYKAVETLEDKEVKMEEMEEGEELREKLVKKVGEVVADRVWKTGRMPLVKAIVESRVGEK